MNRKGPVKRSDEGVRRATGRDRGEWFTVLDTWGAPGRPYREIAEWLTGERGISDWWAQKLIVEYQQARGLRAPGARPDGTFTATASKSMAVSGERVFDAFVDAELRERWLSGASMHLRTSKPGRSARFDWEDGLTRVNVNIAAGEGKSQAAVEHERLPDAETAERTKAFWRDRLTALKTMIEG
ncbi:MAG: hypothetical protein ACT4QB_00475 [Gammaproteobacteria bacterium]